MPFGWRVVGFTGHRELPDERVVGGALAVVLADLSAERPTAVVGSAAAGADTLALEAARALELPAVVILPFPAARFKDGFTPAQWERASALIDHAIAVEVVNDGSDREAGFLESGLRTVDGADIVVAVWNGRPPKGPAGTGAIVAYARALAKPLLIVDPDTGQVARERMPEDRPPPASAPWRTRDLRATIQESYARADTSAAHVRPAAQGLVLRIINLHLIAAGLAVAGVTLSLPAWATTATAAGKVLLLVWAVGLARRHRQAHHEWMANRMAAELSRSYLALWSFRRDRGVLPRVPTPGFDPLRRDLELSWRIDHRRALPLDLARAGYRARVAEQAAYFRDSHATARRRHRLLRRVAIAATMLAIGSGLAALALPPLGVHGAPYAVLKMLSMVLPLANAAALSAILALDLGRRVARYHQLASELAAVTLRLEYASTWESLWRIARDAEELLLGEAGEWLTLTRFGGEHH